MSAPYPRFDGTQRCAAMDPEIFFPSTHRYAVALEVAKAACQACPFQRPCLAHALTHDLQGIWGGCSENERKRLRREHGIKAQRVALTDNAQLLADIRRLDDGTRSAADFAGDVGCTKETVQRHRVLESA